MSGRFGSSYEQGDARDAIGLHAFEERVAWLVLRAQRDHRHPVSGCYQRGRFVPHAGIMGVRFSTNSSVLPADSFIVGRLFGDVAKSLTRSSHDLAAVGLCDRLLDFLVALSDHDQLRAADHLLYRRFQER